MPATLLAVKFFPPTPGSLLTERAQLLGRFTSGLGRPLTLISAPAGFGKSTLLGAWIAQRSPEAAAASGDRYAGNRFAGICWLSLEEADNHASRFWTYFVAAIQTGMKRDTESDSTPAGGLPAGWLDDLLDLLHTDAAPSIQPVLDGLINALTGHPGRILLVLDDYHAIQAPEIHEQMAYLLEHQPPNLHLVISTRSDPPLPIARRRAKGQLSEFRAADLRFTPAEAAEFLTLMTGLDVSGEDAAAIQASTEGWIAGLQMAALALQAVIADPSAPGASARQDLINEFIGSFSGKHIYILDYLTDEVFNRQPPEVQAFLLKTSILDRMSAGLCAAVLHAQQEPSAAQLAAAKAILDHLEKANLFLIPLDTERRWFRYHHLFADLLRARLEQTGSEALPALHLSASRWYAQHGDIDGAVHHALQAREWDWAATLMERHVSAYLEQGQLAAVLKWIDALPTAILARRPVLCTQVAWALAHAGRYQRVPPLIEMIEAALPPALPPLPGEEAPAEAVPGVSLTEAERTRLRATVAILRAFGRVLAAKPDQALQVAQQALASLAGLEPREEAWLYWMCGYACRGQGQLAPAIQSFETALAISRAANTVWEDMSTDLGIAYRFSGKLGRAAQVFEDALRQAEKHGWRNKGNLSRVEAFLSAVRLDQNRLEEALAHAQQGVYYLQWWPSHNHITTAYVYLGLVWLGMGRLDEAAEAIQRAEEEQHKGQVMPTVLRLVEYASIRLWLERGNWEDLDRWLAAQDTAVPDFQAETRGFNEYEEMRLVSLARVWVAKGRKTADLTWLDRALALLSQLEIPARRSQWVHALVEIHLLQAVALHERSKTASGNPGQARLYLTRSLALGLPEGYARVYLQEGPVVAELLQAWLRSYRFQDMPQDIPTGLTPLMVKQLLDRFGLASATASGKEGGGLIEPLTEREREVLQLLALGLSNKEMAERMVVSEGTVKTHVHNLIGKLGAQSRIHVLARARELDLL